MNVQDNKPVRVVLPTWVPLHSAGFAAELTSFQTPKAATINFGQTEAFESALSVFRENPSPFVATDLLGVAYSIGKKEVARELAEFVLAHREVGDIACNFAKHVLEQGRETAQAKGLADKQKDIARIKQRVRTYHEDALAWLEQARLYTTIGQLKKAERCIDVAVSLAPTSRYVVRSAVRFHVHNEQLEKAMAIAVNAAVVTNDPWIYAPAISVATLLERAPTRIGQLLKHAQTSPSKFHVSELLEAHGTDELFRGHKRAAKESFERAWDQPANTVIAHSHWVLRERLPEAREDARIDFSRSAQAMAFVRMSQLDFTGAAESGQQWRLEEPYSSGPYVHGSYVNLLLENYAEAETTTKDGLIANPKDSILLNNRAVALIGLGRLSEAEGTLSPIKPTVGTSSDVALLATWGLLLMRKGELKGGSMYFEAAIEVAAEKNNNVLLVRAIMHYLMAVIETSREVDLDVLRGITEKLGLIHDAQLVATAGMLLQRICSLPPAPGQEKIDAAISALKAAIDRSSKEVKRAARWASQKSARTEPSNS